MKSVIAVLLVMVVISLFTGLYFMFKDKGNSKRVVNALTIRVALSIAIIAILIGSYLFGLMPTR